MAVRRLWLSLVVTLNLFVGTGPSGFAASGNWNGTVDGTWAGANWSASPVPGTLDTATFNGLGNSFTTINLGAGVTIATMVFDTAAAASYTIGSGAVGSQTLSFDNTGAITMNSTVVANQLVNANVTLGTALVGTTTFTNSSTTNSLTIAGNITGGTGGTAGIKTFNITGAGATNLQGTINKGGATVINVANTSTGNTTLSGAGTSALGTLRATGSGTITVNNASANITVASSSSYGASSTTFGKFILTAGTVAFNGGLSTIASPGDGSGFIVNGGTFSASNITMSRTFAFSTIGGATTTTAQAMTTNGFQVNGGIATVSSDVNLAGSNSATNGQVSGTGSLSIAGELILGSGATTRTTLFQVTGGTLTNTNTAAGGIVIGKGSATVASSGELLLTGGTTTTEKITFGLSGGLAGSFGNLTLNGAAASLYVGSGGIVKAATNAFTDTINLSAGTLGAKAAWGSAMNMSLTGNSVTLKAADIADVANNITLTGSLTNNGADRTLTFTGAGTTAIATLNLSEVQATGRQLTLTGAGNVTLGSIADSAAGVTTGTAKGLVFNSTFSGIATLPNASTYTGTTTLSAGNFVLGNKAAFSTTALAANGATSISASTDLSGANAIANTTSLGGNNTFTGSNNIELSGIITATGTRTLTNNISPGALTLSSTLNLSNSATNYTLSIAGSGNTTISGVVQNGVSSTASNLSNIGTGLLSLTNTNTFSGTLTATSGTTRIDHSLAAQNATVSVGAANALTFGTGITNATIGNLSGAGDLALTNTGAGAVALIAGGNNTSTTYSGVLSGAGTFEKVGTGTLTVSNTANSVPFIVSAGSLRGGSTVSSNGGFGSGNITLQDGGTISSAMPVGQTVGFANDVTVATGEIGNINTTVRWNWTGDVTGAGTLNTNVTTNVSRLDFQNDWTGFTGNLNLTGSGGIRLFNNGGNFNTASFTSTTMDLGGSVSLNPQTNSGGNTYPIGALSSSSATAALNGGTAGTATYVVGALNASTTYAGTINGNAALTKVGTGSLTFTGASTSTGAVAVSAGSFYANNTTGSATGAGAVTIANGALLGGDGAIVTDIGKNLTLNGQLAVGAIGATQGSDLSITTGLGGSAIMGSTSQLKLDLWSTTGTDQSALLAAADVLRLFGDVAIASGATLKLGNPNNVTFQAGDVFKIFDWTGLGVLTGSPWAINATDLNLTGGLSLDTTALYSTGLISIMAVPEPSRALLLLIGLTAMITRRRRVP